MAAPETIYLLTRSFQAVQRDLRRMPPDQRVDEVLAFQESDILAVLTNFPTGRMLRNATQSDLQRAGATELNATLLHVVCSYQGAFSLRAGSTAVSAL